MTNIKQINCLSKIRILVLLLCSCLFIGCSSTEKRLQKERLTITYRPHFSFEQEIKKLRLQHPIKISKEQVINHLLSLHYEGLSLLGKKQYVFSPNEVLEIAPLITKALNRMKASKILEYEVETPKGATVGIIFRTRGKINWIFKAIKGNSFTATTRPGVLKSSSWQLLPKNGQRFHKNHSILGNEQKRNWIISDVDLPLWSRRGLKAGLFSKRSKRSNSQGLKQGKSTNRSSGDQTEFKKSLRFLKNLRDQKLIDDNEYKRKKKELLNQFP